MLMPSSLVLAPYNFLFFSRVTNAWKGKRFEDAVMITFSATQQLLGIPKTDTGLTSSSERAAGISASTQKGSTSKGIS